LNKKAFYHIIPIIWR